MHLLNIMPIFFTHPRDISYCLDIYLLKKKRSLLDLRFTSDPVTLCDVSIIAVKAQAIGGIHLSNCAQVLALLKLMIHLMRGRIRHHEMNTHAIYIYIHMCIIDTYERHPRCNTQVTQPKNLHSTYSISTPASYQSCPCPSIFLQPWVNRHVAVIEDQRLTPRPLPVMTGIRPQ